MRGNRIFSALATLVLLVPCLAQAQTVYRHTDTRAGLESRFEWANRNAQNSGHETYWVAYSVMREMPENSWIGRFQDDLDDQPTLAQILTADGSPGPNAETLKDAARRALEKANGKRSSKRVDREVVILSLLQGSKASLVDIDVSNMELSFDLQNYPVFWLGEANDRESIAHLEEAYRVEESNDIREDLVAAVGMHAYQAMVQSFLTTVIASRANDDIRESAVFWLSNEDTIEMVRYLSSLAESDRADEVREAAVFALSRMEIGEALERLIGLARSDEDKHVRETARFWLGTKASDVLVGDANDSDRDTESTIQKQAVFALAQLDDGEGVDVLIDLVHRHNSPAVRKQALFWLGQSDSNRALEAVIEVIRSGS